MTDGVNPTGVNKISVHSKNTFMNLPPTDFPATFSLQHFSELDPDWLALRHPIPNAKFPPITALLNMPTYHKSAKVFPPPFPQILWELQMNQ